MSPGEGARLVRDFEPEIEAAKRINQPSKITSKGQRKIWGRGETCETFEGRGAEGSNDPEAGIKSLQSLKYQMMLCDGPFLTSTHNQVNNKFLRVFFAT